MGIFDFVKQNLLEPKVAVTIDSPPKIRWSDQIIPVTVKLVGQSDGAPLVVEKVEVSLLYTSRGVTASPTDLSQVDGTVVSQYQSPGLTLSPGVEQSFSCSLELHPAQEQASTGQSLNDSILNIGKAATELYRSASASRGSYDLRVQVYVQGYKTSVLQQFTVNISPD